MTPEERWAGSGVVGEVGAFGRCGRLRRLRPYQLEVARAVARSVLDGQGLTFTVLFPRQAGKNELSAQLEAFLLFRHQEVGGSVVKAAPTFQPQIVTSLLRLEQMLAGKLTRGRWTKERGFIVRLGASWISFFSAQPDSNIVGATASLLLEGDEAQDIEPQKWDRDLVPMGASGAATRVLYGTPWIEDTLLGREVARNRELERRDGVKRHFEVGWEAVAEATPAYGRHVRSEIARLGEDHPIVQTQYLLRPLARADRLLSAKQLELLKGDHPALTGPEERPAAWGRGGFVAGLDVAGADEEDPELLLSASGRKRDSTVLTVAYAEDAIVPGSTFQVPGSRGDAGPPGTWNLEPGTGGVVEPRLYVVRQYAWRNAPHRELYPVVLSLVRERWACRRVVVDATGVGGGLAAFLGAALGPRMVTPFLYTAASKSKLAFDFLGAVNSGRLKMHRVSGLSSPVSGRRIGSEAANGERNADELVYEFFDQAAAATYELRANQVMRWGVPAAKGHDDLLNAGALVVQSGPVVARRVATGRRVPAGFGQG